MIIYLIKVWTDYDETLSFRHEKNRSMKDDLK